MKPRSKEPVWADPQELQFVPNATIDLAEIWRDLRAGRMSVECAYNTVDARSVALDQHAAPQTRSERALRILEGVIVSGSKQTALEGGVAPSTVAAQTAIALEQLGAGGRLSRTPLILAFAVHAALSGRPILAQAQTKPGRIIVRLERADAHLSKLLSEGELAVVELLLDGLDYNSIARTRGTSTRTIANQLASAFRQLGISGKAELIRLLVLQKERDSGIPAATSALRIRRGAVPDLPSELAELRSRIALMEAETAALRGRLSALEGAPEAPGTKLKNLLKEGHG